MTEDKTSFPAGIDFDSVLRIISKEVYDYAIRLHP